MHASTKWLQEANSSPRMLSDMIASFHFASSMLVCCMLPNKLQHQRGCCRHKIRSPPQKMPVFPCLICACTASASDLLTGVAATPQQCMHAKQNGEGRPSHQPAFGRTSACTSCRLLQGWGAPTHHHSAMTCTPCRFRWRSLCQTASKDSQGRTANEQGVLWESAT